MEVFVARQPIFNIEEEIVGYELLYRKDLTNVFPFIDGDQATAEVIINSFLNIGLERLTEGKKFSIHFTENLLEQKLPTYFSPDELMVKISKEVMVSNKLVTICRELKERGYLIIIDDQVLFHEHPAIEELLPQIAMIKVDFRKEYSHLLKQIEGMTAKYPIELFAEKIETAEAFSEAKNRGYVYFQGYYFSEPLIESTYDIPTIFSSHYHAIQSMSLEEIDVDELAELIEKDLSLSIKLLKLINTSSFGCDHKICSIRAAIALLGVDKIKNWVHVLSTRESSGEPSRLSDRCTQLMLTRAKLCETIARQIGTEYPSGYYMAGLISTIKELVNLSMEEILKDLPLKQDIHDALLGKENSYRMVLDLVEAVEQAKWKEINHICKRLNITERDLFRIYAESSNWTSEMIREEKKAHNGQDTIILK
ncbi:EAL and HDOD domain-containing protein [Bacillus tuaregi]|uniref:EAL and HDOD domain-containing protein n=1 Tax=Bacillus tuaregi TaxID=1816695 RepID=UPI0008F83E16|nr:HDOD domain-containing protein [Bacillus tuaregi]